MHAGITANGTTTVNTKRFSDPGTPPAPWNDIDASGYPVPKSAPAEGARPPSGPPPIAGGQVQTIIDATSLTGGESPESMQYRLSGAEALQRALNDQANRHEQLFKSSE